jgi:hypothetical protein
MITLYLQGGNKRVYTVLVDSDGGRSWYLNNMLHREDGPAVEWADGTKWWCLNDRLHREDGPAIEVANGIGTKKYYLNGEQLTEEEFNAKMKKTITIDGVTYKLVKE